MGVGRKRVVFAVPGNVTYKSACGPNTLIKQGDELVAAWEEVWENCLRTFAGGTRRPSRLHRESFLRHHFFQAAESPPTVKRVLALLKADESTHIDVLGERLNSYLASSEIFTARFELELNGRIRAIAWEVLREGDVGRPRGVISSQLSKKGNNLEVGSKAQMQVEAATLRH